MDCSWIISWYFIAFIGLFYTNALENGLARTPPMGFMTWQRYRCIIDCDLYPDECIRYLKKRECTLFPQHYLSQ